MARCSLNWTLRDRDSSSIAKRLHIEQDQQVLKLGAELDMFHASCESVVMPAWPKAQGQPAATIKGGTTSTTSPTEHHANLIQPTWTARKSMPTPMNLQLGSDSSFVMEHAKQPSSRLSTLVAEYAFNSRTQREELILVYGSAPSRTTRAMAQGFPSDTMVTSVLNAAVGTKEGQEACVTNEEQARRRRFITPADILFSSCLFSNFPSMPVAVVGSTSSHINKSPCATKADRDGAREPPIQSYVGTERKLDKDDKNATKNGTASLDNYKDRYDSDSDSDLRPTKRRVSTGSTTSSILALQTNKFHKTKPLSPVAFPGRQGTPKRQRRTMTLSRSRLLYVTQQSPPPPPRPQSSRVSYTMAE